MGRLSLFNLDHMYFPCGREVVFSSPNFITQEYRGAVIQNHLQCVAFAKQVSVSSFRISFTVFRERTMSHHSYSNAWLHLIWATLRRERTLNPIAARHVSQHLYSYAADKGIFMTVNHVNSDHVHAVVDLPTNTTIEDMLKMMKGESSHWINLHELTPGRFRWCQGYAAFSVSRSNLERVRDYIGNQ